MTADTIDAIDNATVSVAAAEATMLLEAVQALEQRFREQGRPFLAMCARSLEGECHDVLDALLVSLMGFEPVPWRRRPATGEGRGTDGE